MEISRTGAQNENLSTLEHITMSTYGMASSASAKHNFSFYHFQTLLATLQHLVLLYNIWYYFTVFSDT